MSLDLEPDVERAVREQAAAEGATASEFIARLKAFCKANAERYLSLTDDDLEQAATLWAKARNEGYPTASDAALDADVILAAQVSRLLATGRIDPSAYVVATSNTKHLTAYRILRDRGYKSLYPRLVVTRRLRSAQLSISPLRTILSAGRRLSNCSERAPHPTGSAR